MAFFQLILVGLFLTIFGGGEYTAKVGNVLYQPTFPGYDGPPPLITGKVINNCNNPQFGGIAGIDVANPLNPQQVSLLQAPHDVAFAGVDSATLGNGYQVVAGGNTPCYNWALLPDVSTDLNPKINGLIQGKGGASWWDVRNPSDPRILPDITVSRDAASLKRREILLAVAYNMTDVASQGQTFFETADTFAEYVFQSADDAVIRPYFFKQNGRDYMLLNTISGDLGLAIFDVSNPNAPRQVTTYSPQMNYLLRVKDVCKDIPPPSNSSAYKYRYFEDLNPVHNPNDLLAMQTLATAYWNRVNEFSLPLTTGMVIQGVSYTLTFHTHYIEAQQAMLVSASADFFYLDVSNLQKPKIVFDLSDRQQFPTLQTADGFDMIEYYTRFGKEVAPGYHNSEVYTFDNRVLAVVDHDNYYVYFNGSNALNTAVSVWDLTNASDPVLLTFIESVGTETHTVHLAEFGTDLFLYATDLEMGVKVYNLTDPEAPELLTVATGTFVLELPQGQGNITLSYPNSQSGFTPYDFGGYPEPFRTLSYITNLPGTIDLVPYQVVPLPFDCLVDGEFVYMQARSGVTYIFQQTFE